MLEYWHATPWRLCSAWMLLLTLDSIIDGCGGSLAEVERRLELGRDMLSRGQFADALTHYHAAVEGDPKNYLTYFKRGTVYLALGKPKLAVTDFTRVLELKADFQAARLQRGACLLKQGRLDEARTDFHTAYEEGSEEAYQQYLRVENVVHDLALAEAFVRGGDHTAAIEQLTKVIETCPWATRVREMRADAYLATADTLSAIMDLRTNTRLLSDDTAGHFKLAMLHYSLGQALDSLKEVRECLKLDPEHKECFAHYKKVKKVEKHMADALDAVERKDYTACTEASSKVLRVELKERRIIFWSKQRLCHCHLHAGRLVEAVEACSEALELDRDIGVLCDRADAYISSEMYDEAIRDFHDALDMNKGYERAKEGMQRAQKLQKQSEKRDYYKILGVKRTANKHEITKAYRQMARDWHPDGHKEGEARKMAEKKFVDIAAAKEVLLDPAKREKYDRGEDPLDPESGHHHNGFNPFQQFHQFQGSPFTFKFHFN